MDDAQLLKLLTGQATPKTSGEFDIASAVPVETGFDVASSSPVEQASRPQGVQLPTREDWWRSGKEYLGNTVQAIRHPIQTAQGMGNLALGVGQQFIPGEQPQEVYADAVGEFIKNRYGSVEKALTTLKHDPVGVMADASVVLSGGAGLMTKVGQVGKMNRLVTAGRVAGKAAKVLDPLTVTTKAAGVAAKVVSSPQQRTAGLMVNRLIRPSNKQFSYGHNPGLAIAKEGIVATSFDDLAMKVAQRRQQVGGQIGQALVIPLVNAKRTNLLSALNPLDEALAKARQTPRSHRAVIRRLENAKKDLLGVVVNSDGTETITRNLTSVSPAEAFKFKSMVGELTSWTDNFTEDSIVNSALKKVFTNSRKSLEQMVPGIHGLNERYGNLLEAESAARRQAFNAQRAARSGIMDMVALGVGAGAGGWAGGNPSAAVTGALLSMGARRMVNSPLFRTGMASFLQKSSPEEIAALFRRVPGLQSEMTRAGLLTGTGQQRVMDAQPVQ